MTRKITYDDAVKIASTFIRLTRRKDGYDVFNNLEVFNAEATDVAKIISTHYQTGPVEGTGLDWFGVVSRGIREAQNDPFAFEVLRRISALYIEGGLAPPSPLNNWLLEFLNGDISPPKWPKGKPERTAHYWLICEAVQQLLDAGFHATRFEDAVAHESACDAVAEALRQLSLQPNSYSGVRKIWLSWNKAPTEES